MNVHGKDLPVPSFFQVYNYGGGNGDKDREIVYAELTGNTPALINYFYINNSFPHTFSSKLFNEIGRFNTVGDLYNFIRASLIKKGEIYRGYSSPDYDFNQKVFLLDSGAYNIMKQIAESVDYNLALFRERILEAAAEYYDFADRIKCDIVVGFDLGGKYTEKDGEKKNPRLVRFLASLDKNEINNALLELTVKYIKEHPDYYPYVLATVHGDTPAEYSENTRYILSLEEQYNARFWGFALGGVASYKQVDPSWYNDINLSRIGKRGFIETIVPARASKIVRELVGDRPIHALGCGGYNNIALNYYCGATSFDAASPVRRVGDGSEESTRIVFDPTPSKVGFSKFFMGGINMDNTMRPEKTGYIKLNEVPDSMPLCGCPACLQAQTVHNIKQLYSMKSTNSEANYYSRQLIGLHAVMQHRKLCEILPNYAGIQDFSIAYPNELFRGLKYISERL
ncbi:hypothetical protein [Ruminococcus flavefaciens]|uniref:hypothetical protein n=1 Tax=Ruminococcus flavefaciens TaxID=1265 RepID=UPI0004903E31|nr:hypothetical protein [Ruminococcus flavefaciens]